jgi:signal transduction histidine kinase
VRLPVWLADTVARRFALTTVVAILAAGALVVLFRLFSGVWAREPLHTSGALNEVADMARIIEAAPPSLRPRLATAASQPAVRVAWFDAGTPIAVFLEESHGDEAAARIVAADTQRRVLALKRLPPEGLPEGLRLQPPTQYLMGVRLNDQSWITFSVPYRTWGMTETSRWTLWLLILGICIGASTLVATRRFVGPVRKLASAVREFGANPQAPPLQEAGPLELRQVIRTFNEMQAQIRKFVAYRTMMLAAISHDLRTPLTRVRLRGELIEDAEQQQRLFRDVDEMQSMVDGALAFFRDDAVAEATTTFDLANVLMTLVNDYADQQVEIPYEGPARAVYRGRPFALKRAFNNLVENSIKYATPPEIALRQETRSFVVTVRDRGPGIPQDALGSVFLPYYRAEKSRNRNTGGVGLGLTVAQAIIQAHGGEIVLQNAAGGGLEARVLLPIVNDVLEKAD